MKIIIIGACGRVGSIAALEACGRGHTVIGIDQTIDSNITHEKLTMYRSSIEEIDQMMELLTDCGAVLNAIAPSTLYPEKYSETIQTLIEICKAAKVPKLLSIIGSSSAILPDGRRLLETDYFEEANRNFYLNICESEKIYEQEVELNWGCITPAAFMELREPILRKYRMGDDRLVIMESAPDGCEAYFEISQISLSDFAYACVDELENDTIHQRRCCVGY